jgi:hypothetical protein
LVETASDLFCARSDRYVAVDDATGAPATYSVFQSAQPNYRVFKASVRGGLGGASSSDTEYVLASAGQAT